MPRHSEFEINRSSAELLGINALSQQLIRLIPLDSVNQNAKAARLSEQTAVRLIYSDNLSLKPLNVNAHTHTNIFAVKSTKRTFPADQKPTYSSKHFIGNRQISIDF